MTTQVAGDRLMFDRPLAKEGRLGIWNWTMLLLGVRGTYRKNDSVDVPVRDGLGSDAAGDARRLRSRVTE